MNILIVGGGVAAFEAAVAAAVSAGCKVTVCSKEAVLPYRRPALSRMVAEELSDTAFYFKNSAFYQEKNIEILLEKEAVSIDRTRRSVQFKDGTALPYDRLILATGGDAFIPPVAGAGYAKVLRDYADLQKIRQELAEGTGKAVVIGGGVLGMELADSLLAAKYEVTIVESGPALLARNLDQESAALVMKQLASHPGLTVKTNAKVRKITPESVELEDEILNASMVFFSTGVRSCTTLATDAGLPVNRGIIVNSKMATEDPDIFSCGDAAETPFGTFGLLSAAKTMGHIAGVNASGGNEEFVPEVYPVRMMALGLKLFAAGKINDAVSEVSGTDGNYQRLTRNAQGKLTGVILLGDLKAALQLQKELVC